MPWLSKLSEARHQKFRSLRDAAGRAFLVSVRQALRFSRYGMRSTLVCLGIGLLLIILLWTATLSKLKQDRHALEQRKIREAASLSKTYADQLTRSVEQIDQVTLNIKYFWQRYPGGLSLEDQLQQGLYRRSALLHVAILDRNGELISSTLRSNKSLNLGHKDWFQQHKADRSSGLVIVPPELSPRIGLRIIRFTRRLERADGTFDGVVSVAVEPPYLASFTDEASLDNSAYLSVIKTDGSQLAKKMGESIRSLPAVWHTPPKFQTARGVMTVAKEQFVDEQPRIVAWQTLSDYPLISVVGLSETEALAPYETMASDYRRFAAAGSLGIFLFTMAAAFFISRQAWRKQLENEVKDTYRLATDAAREGFYMVRPVRDENDNVVDFLVEDCNERGANYYGTTRAELIGAKFSRYSAGPYLDVVLNIFRGALETGYYEDEFNVSSNSPLKPVWMHRKLVRSGDGLAVTLRDISEIKAHAQALAQMANADAVTTLPNRHWMMNYLPTAVERARNGDSKFALLFVDLDDFKNINDTLGHAAGDVLLREVALRLRSIVRPQDNVVRLGGDEFNIILEPVEGEKDVSAVAERIIKSFAEPFVLSGGSSHIVRASIGISLFPADGDDGEILLKHADIAMYAAKGNGKGSYEFYEASLSENLVVRLNKEQALRKAIERDEFVLYYQPRVDTLSGKLHGFEALVRWIHSACRTNRIDRAAR